MERGGSRHGRRHAVRSCPDRAAPPSGSHIVLRSRHETVLRDLKFQRTTSAGAKTMRPIRLIRILPLVLVAACAAGAGPRTYHVTFRADAQSSRHVLPYPAQAVWAALPRAYGELQLPAGPVTRDRLEFTTPQLRVQDQLYGRKNSDFFDCGVVDGGRRLEDHGEVMLAMITRLEPGGAGTVVMTQVDVYARRRDVAADPVACSSRGVLEEALVAALRKHLQAAPAAR